MQTRLDIFRSSCHYFDETGNCHQKQESTQLPPPQTIAFNIENENEEEKERVVKLFLKYNPWKLIAEGRHGGNNDQIIYQNCIVCSVKRFERENFNQLRGEETTALCEARKCFDVWLDFTTYCKPGTTTSFLFLKHIEKIKTAISQEPKN